VFATSAAEVDVASSSLRSNEDCAPQRLALQCYRIAMSPAS
jgi:hypothetical protein